MASLIVYSKRQLIQRLRQSLVNDFPSSELNVTENETLLFIDQALAFGLVGQAYAGAKMEGSLVVPEAYYMTYLLPALTKDNVTKTWYSTLPQPPVSLPLGYSLDRCYFANSVDGEGTQVYLIKAKRVAFRRNMPIPFGVRCWIEGSKINFVVSDGTSLYGQNCYVRMASTRTSSLDDVMQLPDDAIEAIYNNVMGKLKDRLGLPQDIVKDDLSPGNKGS